MVRSDGKLTARMASVYRLVVLGLALCWTGFGHAGDLSERQAQLLANNCVQCHARANIGAPLMGKPEDWKARNQQGEEKMLANVVNGLRGMPPFGYCSACNEADLRALIRFMAGLPGNNARGDNK